MVGENFKIFLFQVVKNALNYHIFHMWQIGATVKYILVVKVDSPYIATRHSIGCTSIKFQISSCILCRTFHQYYVGGTAAQDGVELEGCVGDRMHILAEYYLVIIYLRI